MSDIDYKKCSLLEDTLVFYTDETGESCPIPDFPGDTEPVTQFCPNCVKLVARVEQLENKNAELRRYKAAWDIINIDYSNCPDDYTKPHVLIPLSLWEKAVQIIDKGK